MSEEEGYQVDQLCRRMYDAEENSAANRTELAALRAEHVKALEAVRVLRDALASALHHLALAPSATRSRAELALAATAEVVK